MLVIRLARLGKKNQPTYRVVISDKHKDTFGAHLACLGSYNPSVNPKEFKLNAEELKVWLSKGAQPSATVHNLLVENGLITAAKRRSGGRSKKSNTPDSEATSSPTPKVDAATETPANVPAPTTEAAVADAEPVAEEVPAETPAETPTPVETPVAVEIPVEPAQ